MIFRWVETFLCCLSYNMLSLLPQVLKWFFPSILAWFGNPWEGHPMASHFTTEAKKEDMNERQRDVELHQKSTASLLPPNPEIATDYLKQVTCFFVSTNLVVRVIMIVIIETPGKTKKTAKTSKRVSVLTVGQTNIYLGIQARVCRLGNRTLVTEDASETPLCFGSSIFESIFAYDRCEFRAKKTIEQQTWFWAFVGETHKAGDHHWVFSKGLVGSIVGGFLWDDSRDVFFSDIIPEVLASFC